MLQLPAGDGSLIDWKPSGATPPTPEPGGFRSRVAYAAVHVVADPMIDAAPGGRPPIDREATLAIRRHMWDLGLGVAEAMDTAQRGAGVGWETARDLIADTAAEAGPGEAAVYGAATDQLAADARPDLPEITDAYLEQLAFIEDHGGSAILMCSRHLAATAAAPEDYTGVYQTVVSAASSPVLIHWLGEAFDPALTGYWGSADIWQSAETVLELVASSEGMVSGVKLSVLDDDLEIAMRRRLPEGVGLFTGDDLNYLDLILGDTQGHSDALLGVLGPIAPAAVTAFQALDRDDVAGYREALEPTVPLAHHLFAPPTFNYKTGVTFLAYLNGLQPHFRMVSGAEGDRSLPHLARLLVLADEAGLIPDPALASHRMRPLLALGGIG